MVSKEDKKSISNHLDNTSTKYGKVVGIVRRNWKQYAGTLLPLEESQSKVFFFLTAEL
jgi:exoribonuclease R